MDPGIETKVRDSRDCTPKVEVSVKYDCFTEKTYSLGKRSPLLLRRTEKGRLSQGTLRLILGVGY